MAPDRTPAEPGAEKNRRAQWLGATALLVLLGLLATPYARRHESRELRTVRRLIAHPLPAATDRLADVTFVVFDTETTGIDANYERMVEIAAVKVRGGKVLEEKSWLLNPGQFIPTEIQSVHNITPEMVAKSPAFCEVYPEFLNMTTGCVLVAHNYLFDIRFVRMEAERCGFPPPPNVVVDSLRLLRRAYPGLEEYNIAALAKHLGVHVEGELHRAGVDCLSVGLMLFKVFESLEPNATLQDLYDMTEGGVQTF